MSLLRVTSRVSSLNSTRIVGITASRRLLTTIEPLYTAEATAVGGRNGHVKSSDGIIDIGLTLPKALGGPGQPGKSNPEQLFGAGYAACFQGAMALVARNLKIKIPDESTVKARVSIGNDQEKKLGLAVELVVHVPGVDKADVQKVVEGAHQVCPYSRATRGNIAVDLKVE